MIQTWLSIATPNPAYEHRPIQAHRRINAPLHYPHRGGFFALG
jgi:hypothetical protein